MKDKINKKVLIVFLIIICISLGYAFVSTTLRFIGQATVIGQEWKVYFKSYEVDEESVDGEVSIIDGTRVEFTAELEKPRDRFEFTLDLVNEGTLDAGITLISDETFTEEEQEVLDYYICHENGLPIMSGEILKPGQTVKLIVIAKYKEDSLATEDMVINHAFEIKYEMKKQVTENDPDAPKPFLAVYANNASKIGVSDIVMLGSIQEGTPFLVIDEDETTVTLALVAGVDTMPFADGPIWLDYGVGNDEYGVVAGTYPQMYFDMLKPQFEEMNINAEFSLLTKAQFESLPQIFENVTADLKNEIGAFMLMENFYLGTVNNDKVYMYNAETQSLDLVDPTTPYSTKIVLKINRSQIEIPEIIDRP